MWGIIGFIVGLIIHFVLIRPIEEKVAREWCKQRGLVPNKEQNNVT